MKNIKPRREWVNSDVDRMARDLLKQVDKIRDDHPRGPDRRVRLNLAAAHLLAAAAELGILAEINASIERLNNFGKRRR